MAANVLSLSVTTTSATMILTMNLITRSLAFQRISPTNAFSVLINDSKMRIYFMFPTKTKDSGWQWKIRQCKTIIKSSYLTTPNAVVVASVSTYYWIQQISNKFGKIIINMLLHWIFYALFYPRSLTMTFYSLIIYTLKWKVKICCYDIELIGMESNKFNGEEWNYCQCVICHLHVFVILELISNEFDMRDTHLVIVKLHVFHIINYNFEPSLNILWYKGRYIKSS